jgi:hypothetical protein
MLKQLCLIAIFSPFRVGYFFYGLGYTKYFIIGYRYMHGFSTPDKGAQEIYNVAGRFVLGCNNIHRSPDGFWMHQTPTAGLWIFQCYGMFQKLGVLGCSVVL